MTAFRVQLPQYQGPCDLLVELIRARELQILEIELSVIASTFLDYLRIGGATSLEEAGDFIVLLSALLELKSRELIPRPLAEEVEVETEKSSSELVRQLLEYRRFKEAASLLGERADLRQRKFARGVDELSKAVDPAEQPIREIELWDLVSAFSRLMRENIVPVTDEVPKDPTPLPVYMERLEAAVLAAGQMGIPFADLFGRSNTKVQLIGKFLALLELVKSNRVWVEVDASAESLTIMPPRNEGGPVRDPSEIMADATVPPEYRDSPLETSSETLVETEQSWTGPSDAPLPRGESTTTNRRSAWEDFEPLVE